MRSHVVAEGLGQDHPLLSPLGSFLRRRGYSDLTVEFLESQLYFAYPRTLWFKISVTSEELSLRHRLNPKELISGLNEWLRQKKRFRNLVFDLRDVTIFDSQNLLELFLLAGLSSTRKYFLTDGKIEQILRASLRMESADGADAIFTAESDLLIYLRDIPITRFRKVKLPSKLTFRSLDAALCEQASTTKLRDVDGIAFDMTEVESMSFRAHSMLSPIVHSLAHSHGILATILHPRARIGKEMVAHGSLRVVRSYLVQVPFEYLKEPETISRRAEQIMPMKMFGPEDLGDLQRLCAYRLDKFINDFKEWFANVSFSPTTSSLHLREVFECLFVIIYELTENVTRHAHGFGYVMMELDPLPERGLSIYIGDTGIGLARGISYTYKLKTDNLGAVKKALQLIDDLPLRRRRRGTMALGGRGWEHVGQMLKRLSGTVRVRSVNAMAIYSPAKSKLPTEAHSNLYKVQGTHVHLRIPSMWKALQSKPKPS